MEGVSRAGSLGQYHSLHLWVQPLGDHASGEEGRTGGGKRAQARCYHVSVQPWNPQGCWEALENQPLLLLGPPSSSLGVVREASWPLPWGGAGHLWREWGTQLRSRPGLKAPDLKREGEILDWHPSKVGLGEGSEETVGIISIRDEKATGHLRTTSCLKKRV